MADKAEVPRCSGDVWVSTGRFGRHAKCPNRGKVQRDGKWWCGMHDPERVAAKENARRAKWAADDRVRAAARELERARLAAADVVERYLRGSTEAWEADVLAASFRIALARDEFQAAGAARAELGQ